MDLLMIFGIYYVNFVRGIKKSVGFFYRNMKGEMECDYFSPDMFLFDTVLQTQPFKERNDTQNNSSPCVEQVPLKYNFFAHSFF
jgi:hypothetical protein